VTGGHGSHGRHGESSDSGYERLAPLFDELAACPDDDPRRLALREELAASRAQLTVAREVERRRLRRDVHDGVGPSLAAIRLRVETAIALLPPGSASGSLLADVPRDLHDMGTEMRRITEDLRPPALERLGLGGALAELVGRLSNPALPVELVLPDRLPALSPGTELATYRIAAEALADVRKAMGVGPVRVRQ